MLGHVNKMTRTRCSKFYLIRIVSGSGEQFRPLRQSGQFWWFLTTQIRI